MNQTPDTLEVLQSGLATLHRMLDEAASDMTLEQLNRKNSDGGVSPFFSLWHYVRTEDNIINFVIQRKPTVWIEEEFDTQLGLHRTAQGTGMTDEEASQLNLSNLELWREYQHKVWDASEKYLSTVTSAELHSQTIAIKPLPEMSLYDGLFNVCLTHGLRHVGEIEYVRGVIGLGELAFIERDKSLDRSIMQSES